MKAPLSERERSRGTARGEGGRGGNGGKEKREVCKPYGGLHGFLPLRLLYIYTEEQYSCDT